MALWAQFLNVSGRNSDVLRCTLNDWHEVENIEAVDGILAQLQGATRHDVYTCAEEYELADPGYEGDADYYVERARRGRVLYLGIGTGRIFLKILKANPNVVGLDSSPEMLRLLSRRQPHLSTDQVLLADAARTELPPNQFDTIVAPYSFLQVLDEESLPLILQNVQRWLKPGGRFHTDVYSPFLIPFRMQGLEASIRTVRADIRVAIYILNDHLQQTMTELAQIDSPRGRKLLEMRLHYYFPKQLAGLFCDAGLPQPIITGGYHGEPFDARTNEILVLETSKPMNADRIDTVMPVAPPQCLANGRTKVLGPR